MCRQADRSRYFAGKPPAVSAQPVPPFLLTEAQPPEAAPLGLADTKALPAKQLLELLALPPVFQLWSR
jgi:hypothetical protein